MGREKGRACEGQDMREIKFVNREIRFQLGPCAGTECHVKFNGLTPMCGKAIYGTDTCWGRRETA